MNSRIKTTWTIAKWEFSRYFKIRDQLIGLAMILLCSVIGFCIGWISQSVTTVEIGLKNANPTFQFPEDGMFRVREGSYSEKEWQDLIEKGEVEGLLILPAANSPLDQAKLMVRRSPSWLGDLQAIVGAEWLKTLTRVNQLDQKMIEKIVNPPKIEVMAINDSDNSESDAYVANGFIFAIVVTSWIAMAFMMTGITGEKQQRVTEQVVSIVRPQKWMDGKLIGITCAAIGSMANLFLAMLIFIPMSLLFFGGEWIPPSLKRWDLVPIFFAYYVGGVLFWNCFYAAISAMIDDPNTSSRSALLFIPMLPLSAAFFLSANPDGLPMQILSLLPGASSTAMPVRLILGEVSWWELASSFVFLILGIFALRIVAARIFAAGIMMYGTEPSWIDVFAWVFSRKSITPGQVAISLPDIQSRSTSQQKANP